MQQTDMRVRYTKEVTQKALLNILKKKSIDSVSVTELCKEAKINRGTFYLHYSTPNDVLMEIEEQFMETNSDLFYPYFNEEHEISKFEMLFASILKNIELCKIIMSKNGNPRFLEKIKNSMRKEIIDGWMKDLPDFNRDYVDYVFDYVFEGSMYLITHWIDDEGETDISTEELANRLDRLGYHSLLSTKEFIKP